MDNTTDYSDEEHIFSILAHPIRRQALKYIYNNHGASFTQLSDELQISTGSIYHHLKELDTLIMQSEQKKYKLTDRGTEVVEQYLHQSRIKVQQIESFTYITNKYFNLIIEKYPSSIILIMGIIILGNLLASQTETFLLGAVIIPATDINYSTRLIGSILYTIFLLTIYYLLVFIQRGGSPKLNSILNVYTISLLVSNTIIITLFLLLQVFVFTIPLWLFILLNIISQVWFVSVITAGTIQYHGLPVSASIISALALLYIGLFLNLFI